VKTFYHEIFNTVLSAVVVECCWLTGACVGDDAERVDHFHAHHMQTSQPLFPSSICAAAIHVIQLLEDVQVNTDGVAGIIIHKVMNTILCELKNLKDLLSLSPLIIINSILSGVLAIIAFYLTFYVAFFYYIVLYGIG